MLDKFHTALGIGLATAAARSSEEKELLELERAWAAALIVRDVDAMNKMISDDFLLVWIDGSIVRKPAILVGTAARQVEIEPFDAEDVEVRTYGQLAVLTGRATLKMKLAGQVEICQFRYTKTFARSDAGWQTVAAQAALMRPPKSLFGPAPASIDADDDEGDVVGRAARQDHVEQIVGGNVRRVGGQLVDQFFVLDQPC